LFLSENKDRKKLHHWLFQLYFQVLPYIFLFLLLLKNKNYKKNAIISYNVNRIRAAISRFYTWLQQDLMCCLQELKLLRANSVIGFRMAGYPYHYWFPAKKRV
jgi:exodeoxyribonuclease-3